jgi:rhodanese-related sulfurtransferase
VTFEELKAFAESTPMLSLALVGLTIALIVTEIARLFRGYKGLRPAELTALINREDPVVVDLSPQGDFEKGHIAGSRHAQAAQFGPEHKLVAGAKDRPVVLVCRSGNSASTAAAKLKKAGFTKVHVLEGGVAAWQQAELPLVKGRH